MGQYPGKNQGITINSSETLRSERKSIVDQFPTQKAKLRKQQNGSGITSRFPSPKCLYKTSSACGAPLNLSQHFQRIFLGMLEASGWSQGWEISSSPPGSAPLNHPQLWDFHHPNATNAPPPVPKGENSNFSLKIIYYSKFSQEFASLENL